MSFTNEEINIMMKKYTETKKTQRDYYHNVRKHNEEFKNKNKERATKYYNDNKEKSREKYIKDKEFISSRNLYNYYRKNNKVDVFEKNHKVKYDLLVSRNVITSP